MHFACRASCFGGTPQCECVKFRDSHTLSDCLMALELAEIVAREPHWRDWAASRWLKRQAMHRLAELAERER